ncbi:MAG: hypothetical protein GC154_09955 [bacterium]|nr:hypothetical protein [bacterium]
MAGYSSHVARDMKVQDLAELFFVVGKHHPDQKQVNPLFFDLPGDEIAIPVWTAKTRAYSWLEWTFLRAEYDIVEVKRDEFIANLIGTRCSCLLIDPEADDKTFPPEKVVAIPRIPGPPPDNLI